MIYAKTKLKKLPERCNLCKFSEPGTRLNLFAHRVASGRRCTLLNKECIQTLNEDKHWMYTRLKDCPLVVIE